MLPVNSLPAKSWPVKRISPLPGRQLWTSERLLGPLPHPQPLDKGPGHEFGSSVSACAVEHSGIYQGPGDMPETREKPYPLEPPPFGTPIQHSHPCTHFLLSFLNLASNPFTPFSPDTHTVNSLISSSCLLHAQTPHPSSTFPMFPPALLTVCRSARTLTFLTPIQPSPLSHLLIPFLPPLTSQPLADATFS